MSLRFFFSFIFFFCQLSFCYSQNYTSRLFSKDQSLPDPYVYCVSQSRDGFLWVSTTKGLSKFDGQFFLNYNLSKGADDFIFSSAADKNGNLWFGTFAGKIYTQNKLNFKPEEVQIKINGSINKLLASKFTNRLFVFSKGNGLFVLENKQLERLSVTENYDIMTFEELNKDELLLGTTEGLIKLDVTKNEASKIEDFNNSVSRIQKLMFKKNAFMIYEDGKGITEIEVNRKQDELIAIRVKQFDKIPSNDLSIFYFNESDNSFYLGTKDEHFYIINYTNNKVIHFSDKDYAGLANGIFVDTESNIWVSTTGKGLYRFFKTNFDIISTDENECYALIQDNNETFFIGTKDGILIKNKRDEHTEKIFQIGSDKLGKVNSLFIDKRGILWIGTENRGLFLINSVTHKKVEIEFSEIKNIGINSINGNQTDDNVQVNTNLDGVFIYKSYALQHHFSVQNSLLHNNVYFSLRSKSGNIYYATHNTAFNFSFNDQLFELNVKDNGLTSDYNAFAEDNRNSIIIATNGDGLYTLKDTLIKPFQFNDKLESKFCSGVIFDRGQNLWIMQRYNLYKFYSKQKVLKKLNLSFDNQLLFNTNAIFINNRGDLFFGTNKNIIQFNNDSASQIENRLPKSHIISVKLFDSIINADKDLELKNAKYNFQFAFSALSLKNSEDVRFTYMLEGRDTKWCEPDSKRMIEYSNLAEGSYIFKVKAINSEGFEEIKPTVFKFTIDKPFWQKPLFWIMVILLVVVIVLTIVKVRTAALIKIKINLEKTVAEKTKELREEKEIIILNNKVIEEQHEDITASITYAKRIQDALLPDISILKEKSTDTFIFYQPRDIVSGDFYWLGEINGLKIIVAADCTGHSVPGAFMSMIGNTLLNKIVLERKITRPKDILGELDREVRKSLKQYTLESTKDGMDVALYCLDSSEGKIIYAGALRPLFYVRNGELIEYSATKLSIGGFNYGADRQFQEIEIDGLKNDMLYIFSDGYADQFGGPKGKKFMIKNFKELLVSVANMDLEKQHEVVKDAYNSWKSDLDQIDDVLVIGLRI